MLKKIYDSRTIGFAVLVPIYALALWVGLLAFRLFPDHELLVRLFTADAAATAVIFAFSLLLGNASVYDPYWSVAPILILPLTVPLLGGWNTGAVVLLALVALWGLRLTWNWSQTFMAWTMQDWRYDMLRSKSGFAWPLVNFFGIHFFPTVMVYLALIPGFFFIRHFTRLTLLSFAGIGVCLAAVLLQATADRQMRQFRQNPLNKGQVNREGLWRHIRHPNYLGEILMWWGVFILMMSQASRLWLAVVGPLAMTCMFALISVPMMEKRQMQNKPDYADYQRRAGILLPRFK